MGKGADWSFHRAHRAAGRPHVPKAPGTCAGSAEGPGPIQPQPAQCQPGTADPSVPRKQPHKGKHIPVEAPSCLQDARIPTVSRRVPGRPCCGLGGPASLHMRPGPLAGPPGFSRILGAPGLSDADCRHSCPGAGGNAALLGPALPESLAASSPQQACDRDSTRQLGSPGSPRGLPPLAPVGFRRSVSSQRVGAAGECLWAGAPFAGRALTQAWWGPSPGRRLHPLLPLPRPVWKARAAPVTLACGPPCVSPAPLPRFLGPRPGDPLPTQHLFPRAGAPPPAQEPVSQRFFRLQFKKLECKRQVSFQLFG